MFIADCNWKYRGLETIILDNGYIRVEIFPELGAKIRQITHKKTNTDLLWENPRLILGKIPYGSSYDDNFFGGWDELLPNDEPIMLNGEPLPDHGEIWTRQWEWNIVENSFSSAIVHLWCYGSVYNYRIDKWITLENDSGIISISHKINNMGNETIRFLWKLHPALSISPNHRIDLPSCKVLRVSEEWSDKIGEDNFLWPGFKNKNGNGSDFREIFSAGDNFKEFAYAVELEDGWCSLTDSKNKIGFGMTFPREIFNSIWLFITDGGWRGYRTAVLEPCTTYPKELDIAIKKGTCSVLSAGESIECETKAFIYEGIDKIESKYDMEKYAGK